MPNQSNPPAEKKLRCGMVSIVGRPNTGKSTLLNRIIGEKVAIVSNVPQTTRNRIRGIYTDDRGQVIFIDTPGLVMGKDKFDQVLKRAALGTLPDADCIIHLVDTNEHVGREEEALVAQLKDRKAPVILGLNKVDLKGKYIHEYIALWERIKGKPVGDLKSFVLLPLSGKDGTHIEKLLEILFEILPEGPMLYPEDIVCDVPRKMVMADIIREKLFHILRQEVPHSIAVVIESAEPQRNKTLRIRAVILVERDSQKEIVIGKGGSVLKKAGTLARQELEELLGAKIFLETHVKLKKNWREDLSLLQELGYDPTI